MAAFLGGWDVYGLMIEFLGGLNGLWAMVWIEFVGYGGVVGRLWPLFFLFFPSPICGF